MGLPRSFPPILNTAATVLSLNLAAYTLAIEYLMMYATLAIAARLFPAIDHHSLSPLKM